MILNFADVFALIGAFSRRTDISWRTSRAREYPKIQADFIVRDCTSSRATNTDLENARNTDLEIRPNGFCAP